MTIVQSVAIARYIARENGLGGKTSIEIAQADMLVECNADFINKSEYLAPRRRIATKR
jgi:hypothetical protein